ncbi:MAG: hypothetical protein Kow00124_10780 [Anaerolineae bacterium]
MNSVGWLKIVVLIVLVFQVPNILILIYSLVTFRKRTEKLYAALGESQDASHLGLTPPPAVQPIVTALQGLGFTQVGEVQAAIPGMAAPHTAWVFADASRTVMGDAAGQQEDEPQGYGTLATVFPDDAYVFSGYRLPEMVLYKPIEDPDFRAHYFSDSLPATYQHHQAQVAEMSAMHGEPLPVESIADYQRMESLFRRLYMRRRRAPAEQFIMRRMALLLGVAFFDVLLILGLYALIAALPRLAGSLEGALVGWLAALVITGLVFGSLAVSWWLRRGLPRPRRRPTRGKRQGA